MFEHTKQLFQSNKIPLIYGANQWTGFYMITVSVMAELNVPIFMYKINQKIAPNIFLARS